MTGYEARAVRAEGRTLAQAIRAQLKAAVADVVARGEKPPGLAVVLVGEDPASVVYVGQKVRACAEVGFASREVRLPATTDTGAVLAVLDQLNADPHVHGILVQMPLPPGIDRSAVLEAIDPRKDADGLHPVNLGRLLLNQPGPRPCTPRGIMALLEHYGVPVAGRRAVVVGRSHLVGLPVALMLTAAHATVTVCHSRTPDIERVAREADILVVAAGRAGLVTADWVKPGAAVVDVGITRTETGLKGDVDQDAVASVAGWLTPVPGGVGPMTIAMLLQNTWEAYQRAAG
ncbi:MAG: bifunctional methylenetetrahydrofolate dehydrogenase/methenyltetrahydrofolate cyclohydrolase FolD [Actinomycetia bacterium]|nr:bifunctional methylenetetrahydrofolate dehydrogenase/methenyltetrahydrofolate cyclohydrolase FolD [Actinomycetes bacterium]